MKTKILSILALLLMTVTQGAWAQTTADIGRVIAADGKMYKTVTLANKVSTASGVVAYVGSTSKCVCPDYPDDRVLVLAVNNTGYQAWGSTGCTHGGAHNTVASALTHLSGNMTTYMLYNEHISTSDGHHTHLPAYQCRTLNVAKPSGAHEWFWPSVGQWNLMVKGLTGSYADLSETVQSALTTVLNGKIQAAGAEAVPTGNTILSTSYDGNEFWEYSGSGRLYHIAKSYAFYFRAMFTMPASATNGYVVEYDANNGSGAPSAQSKTLGTALTLSSTVPTREGYTFAGWNTKADGSGTSYAAGASYETNADVVLYAKWTPVPTPVDLGLPSGKKWADMNVGAGSATGYGTYFAWSSSDIATAQWGSNWRMPTKAEIEELKSYTDHEWATIGVVNGMKFMKKTDHSVYIFLPATGLNSSENVGSVGFYWTSTEESSTHAYFLYASSSTLATSYKSLKTDKLPIRPVQMFVGEGTQASPYLIASTTDWDNLVSAVNGGETYSGKYFKMTANVGTVSTWMTGTFSGTFDGYGKTLTVGYSSSASGCAPFGNLRAATIKNLIVDGTISTSGERAGGIAWWVLEGSMTYITNCRVAATINSTFSGGASTGGFVGSVQDYGTDGKLTITGCAFTGSLLGSSTHTCGGFVGWNGGTLTIENSLFAPASVTIGTTYSATFTRGGTVTNSYYTQKFNEAQGMQARTIAKGDGVSTLSVTKGSGTTYNVAGITVYSNGVDYNSTFYGGSGQSVSLALTAETCSGYQFKQYAASQGTLSGETTDAPTLTMPAANSTANDVVTISAEYDPLYNATFADASDASNGWTISPTQQIAGGTVTVSYEGENKVKSVTVTNKYAIAHSLAASVVGDIVGTDGNAYAVAEKDKLPVGVTAAGVVTYKSGENGIVVALQNLATKYSWSDAFTAAAAYTPAVSGQTWKLGTKDELTNALTDDYATKYSYITAAGGTFPYFDNYWSATEDSGNTSWAWRIWVGSDGAPAWHNYNGVDKTYECQVRPIIAF